MIKRTVQSSQHLGLKESITSNNSSLLGAQNKNFSCKSRGGKISRKKFGESNMIDRERAKLRCTIEVAASR